MKRARPAYPVRGLLRLAPAVVALGMLACLAAMALSLLFLGPDGSVRLSNWSPGTTIAVAFLAALFGPGLVLATWLLGLVAGDLLHEHREDVRLSRQSFEQAAHSPDALLRPASAAAADTLMRPAHHAAHTDPDNLPRPTAERDM